MWEPLYLTTLWAFTACYRDSFTLFTFTDKDACLFLIRLLLCFHSLYSWRMKHCFHCNLKNTGCHITVLFRNAWINFLMSKSVLDRWILKQHSPCHLHFRSNYELQFVDTCLSSVEDIYHFNRTKHFVQSVILLYQKQWDFKSINILVLVCL
jgi:hypothetical protein